MTIIQRTDAYPRGVFLAALLIGGAVVFAPTSPIASAQSAMEAVLEGRRQIDAGRFYEGCETIRAAIPRLPTAEERITQWLALAEGYKGRPRTYLIADALAHAVEELEPYDPRHWQAVDELVTLYCRLHRPWEAVRVLESLVEGMDPGRGDRRVWMRLADIRHRMGDADWALHVYRMLMRPPAAGREEQQLELLDRIEDCQSVAPGQPSFNQNLQADALLSRFQTRMHERDYEGAVSVLAELLTRFPDAAFVQPDVAAVGTRAYVSNLLANLDESQRGSYEQACRLSLEKALRIDSSESLEAFLFTHPWPPFTAALTEAIAESLLQEGRFARSAAFYRRLTAIAADDAQVRRAWAGLARSEVLAGGSIPANVPLDAPITLVGKEMRLGEAIRLWRSETLADREREVRHVPLGNMRHDRLRLQQAPLVLKKWQVGFQQDHSGRNPLLSESFIPYVPAGDRRQVIVNTSEMVCAIDPADEKLLWTQMPTDRFVAELAPPVLKDLVLLDTPKQSRVALTDDAVFYRLNWADRAFGTMRSAVFAARRDDGQLLWSTEGIAELSGMRFACDPAYGDGVVVAAVWEPKQLPVFHLVGLDGVTGELLWISHLFSGAMFPALRGRGMMDSPLASPPPAIADGVAYFTASMGVLSAVDLQDGSVRWQQTYPRVAEFECLYQKTRDRWSGEFVFNRPAAPILVRDGLLLVAPRDARGFMFFDAESGRLVRRYERMDFRVMFAADDRYVYVQQGASIAAIRLHDATVAWERVLPAEMIIGMPSLSERGIICCTSEGMLVLSAESGEVIEELPRSWSDPVGTPIDLGDRVMAFSISAAYCFAEKPNGGIHWRTPRAPHGAPLTVDVRLPGGAGRWVLPAPDRGNFFLSDAAPDLVMHHSWETYEMREAGPAPTLLWEFAGPSWPRSVHYDHETAVFDYTSRLIAVDASTGKTAWDVHDGTVGGDRSEGSVLLHGKYVIWHSGYRLQARERASGKLVSQVDFDRRRIIGILPEAERLAVFLNWGKGPCVEMIDLETGDTLRHIELIDPADPNVAYGTIAANSHNHRSLLSRPVAMANGQHLVHVDLASGEVRRHDFEKQLPVTHIRCSGDIVQLSGGRGLVAALRLPDLIPVKVHGAPNWTIADNVQYYVNGPRIAAQRIDTGEPLWQSRALTGSVLYMAVSGRHVLAVLNPGQRSDDPRGQVIVIDRETGDVTSTIGGLATEMRSMGHVRESLYTSDDAYLYRFADPGEGAAERARVSQSGADVEALLAVRLAHNLNDQEPSPVEVSQVSPHVDGRLDEWTDATWYELSWPEAWRPDHVLLSGARPRRTAGVGDIGARIALARSAEHVYLAVRVTDDIHGTSPERPLTRGDSVHWRLVGGGGKSTESLSLTAALVENVPCLDVGIPVTARAAWPSMDGWPAWLSRIVAEEDVAWLRRRRAGAVDMAGVRLAVTRDESNGETLYEIAVANTLLPGTESPDGGLLFDVAVFDADGSDCKGGLELGTGLVQLMRDAGYFRLASPSTPSK